MAKKTLTADAVIIATGASAKWLGLPSESRLNGSGVSACAVCDGFFYRKQTVAIVGAGDTACEEALYLSKICLHVHMLVRKSTMRASKIMEERVKKYGKYHHSLEYRNRRNIRRKCGGSHQSKRSFNREN
eukprot:Opistho-2@87282